MSFRTKAVSEMMERMEESQKTEDKIIEAELGNGPCLYIPSTVRHFMFITFSPHKKMYI